MTRAREELILLTSESPSCFLKELPEDTVNQEEAQTKRQKQKEIQLNLFDWINEKTRIRLEMAVTMIMERGGTFILLTPYTKPWEPPSPSTALRQESEPGFPPLPYPPHFWPPSS